MIQKALLAPVLVMCLIQIISSALFTYIFPFVASCERPYVQNSDWTVLLSMDVDERDVPVYAGWADSMVSLVDVLGLPIVSLAIR